MQKHFITVFLIVAVGVFTSGSSSSIITGPLPGMGFVLIPGGSFMMGSLPSEPRHEDDESPRHKVTLEPFHMQTTEVTQAQWKAVIGSNPSHFKGDSLPVEEVSWDDVQEFILKLNQMDSGKGYRLPTEVEWEYACRAGTNTTYYSGIDEAGLERVCWYKDNSESRTHPVRMKEPNAWGLYDMHGNVWEWCEDWYHDNYNGAPTDGSARLSSSSGIRVIRGGSWYYFAGVCRSANRFYHDPSSSRGDLGFRLVRSAD
ncbi:MAG: formylglycine-generating enzyme family protein [candidate division Zixibacteria bacterium]|nr:formylglycine-generating enzyme family protein [Candidatus Tariuqbacter arcticus]